MFITLYSIKKRAAAVQNFRRCYSPHSPGERRPNMGKAKEIPLCSRVHPTHMLSLESVQRRQTKREVSDPCTTLLSLMERSETG